MNKPFTIKLSNAAGAVQIVEVVAGQKQATVVEVAGHSRVELVNPATGRAPQTVLVRRAAKDLHVVFEDGNPDEPDLILQGFYDQDDRHLVGLAEDGGLFEYVPTSGDDKGYVPMLLDGSSSVQALGEFVPAAAQAVAAEGLSPWLLGAIGLGVVGAAVAIARSGDGSNGNGGSVAILPTPTQRPSGYLDNVGSIQAPDSNAPVTDDNTPGLHIGALPTGATGAVLYVDGVRTPATYDPATGNLTPQSPLADGKHSLGYGLTNPGGTTPSSPTLEVTIDTVPPTAPVLRVVDSDGDGRPDISGTGEPGGRVIITDPTGATHTTTVQPDGSFALEIDRPTTPTGDWRATVTDPAGNISPPGRVTVTDLTAPVVPTVDGVLDNVGLVTGLVLNNGATDDTTPTYTGTAERGSKVTLFNALNQPIGTTTADAITGLWSLTPTTVLPDGTYTVTARATDVSGNTSLSSAPFVFTVDTVTPAPATVYSLLDDVGSITGQIVNGTVTDDTRPTMSGKAEANSTITIRDGTQVLGTTSAGTSGYWTFTPTTDLVQGPHSWSATVSDRAGNTSTATTPIAFVVDTTPPAQATITSVFDDQGASTGNLVNAVATVTDDAQPLIRGTAEANSTVIIKDGTVQIGTASVDGLGIWFFTPTPPLLNGIHHITAAAVDAAGNVGLASGVFDFTLVAGGIASAPAITNVIDDVGILANIAPNGLTNDPTPTVRGTADAGHIVRLYSEAGALLGTYVVLADGQWSITVPTLADGAHSFTATATDANNNVSPPTQPYQIVVDTTAPGPATVLTLTDNVNPQTGLITTGSTTDDATPTFEGTAEPGATVLVKDGVLTLGTAQVNELGRWAFTPTTPLVDGPHALTATVTDKAGNVSTPTAAISFTVDTTRLVIAIDSVFDDIDPISGNLAANASTNDRRPTISGHATPGGTVKLYVDGVLIPGATTTVGSDGQWHITPGTDLAQGPHLLTATLTTGAAGESTPTAPFAITVDSLVPNVPALVSVEDNVGTIRGLVPAGAASDDSTPLLTGTAEANSKVTILDGGQPIGTTMADGLGNWTFTPASPLNDGTHAITVTATDAAGNVSPQSTPWSVVIDTTAPTAAPVITSVMDDQGSSTGNLVSGVATVTDDASPLITGTSEPNGSVIIKDGTQQIGTAAVNGLGIWTFTPTTPLLNGVHHITATSVDASGNVGLTSTPFDFTLTTGGIATAPAITNVIDDVGTIANIAPNGLTNDPTPTVKGTAHAGYIVTLNSETGALLGTYQVLADGQWSITVPTLADGAHSFTATATDPTNNVSPPTQPYQIVVDTTAPGPATVLTLTDNVNPQTGLIVNGNTTDDATPTFEGTGEVGATVQIKDGINPLGTAKVNELGRWTFTPTTPLDDGAHSFTATVTDAAGNTSPATTPINFTVDTTRVTIAIDSVFDDIDPVTGNLAANASTNDRRPTVSGTATPGGTVKLYLDGVLIAGATTTVGSDGQWHITPGTDLSQGRHLLTATVSTAATGESLQTGPFTLTVDSLVPDPPVLLSVTDNVDAIRGLVAAGGSTNDSTPLLKGTAEANSKVTILDGGQPIGTTTADGLGNWTFTPASPLNDGTHAITLTATDAAGNVSQQSLPWSVVVDTTAPTAAPAITSVFDDQGTSTGNLVDNVATVTDDAQPLITGTSEPNGSVIIKDGTQQIGTASVNSAGIWTFTPTTPLFNGVHHITATAVDGSGNTGLTSTPFDFTLTTGGIPTAPAITNVIDDVGTIENIAQNGLTNDPTPTVKGTARAGSIVMLYSESGALLGTYQVMADGQWSITVPTLTDGAHSFTATATDAALNVSLPTEAYQIVVDTVAPGSATVLTLTDNVNPRTGLITTGTVTDDATPTFEGTGEVGATVEIKDGVSSLGTTKVNELGRWTFTPITPLDDGAHSFTAVVTDKAGNVSPPTTPINFTVDTTAALVSIDSVFDDVNAIIGNLAPGDSTNDRRPTISGTATPGGTVKLYVDGVLVAGATTTAGSDGQWHITPGIDLAQGLHLLTATVTTSAAGESLQTGPFTINVDSLAPDIPALVSVTDNVDAIRGLVAAGTPSNDNTPLLKGTAEALSKVTILDGGQPIGTTTADRLGNWTFTPASPLNDGTHAITLTATDAAGNVSLQSLPWSVVIDTTAPTAAPVITSVFDDQGSSTGNLVDNVATVTDDASPLITGTSEPNGSVIIKDGTQQIGTASVNGAGIWTFIPTTPLLNGIHQITATAVDGSGNTGLSSTPFDFTLTTGGVPKAPAITNVIDDVGTIENIAPNGLTNDPTPTVKGTARGGSVVKLYSETNVLLGTYQVLADGQWSITVPTLLDGTHSFTATATDPASNVSLPTQPYQIVVDTTAPGLATALTLTDNVNPRTGLITTGTVTDDATPTFEGTGEIGATVEIKDGVMRLGTAQVNELGRWTFTPTTPLDDGAHSFTATVTDKAGNASLPTTPINFTVDTSNVAIAIDSVFDDVNAIIGNLAPGDSTNDRRPTISGTATPGGTVKLYVDGVFVAGATATVGSDGQWHITPGTDLAQGPHLLTATVTTPAAGESLPTGPFSLVVDSLLPDAPAIVSVTDNVDPMRGLVADGAASDDSTPTLTGTAEADSKVTIRDGGQPIGTTMADHLGNWTFTPASPLNDGTHAITLTSTDAAGNVSLPSAPWSLLIDTVPPAAPLITASNDNVAPNTGDIASGLVTNDPTPLMSGTADANVVISLYDGTVLMGTTQANGLGIWSFTPTLVGDRVHAITVTATDAAGNVSAPSAIWNVNLDVSVPTVRTITASNDNVVLYTGDIASGIATNDATPLMSGTAEANSKVSLYDGTVLMGTTTASALGTWSFTPTLVGDRIHEITITVTNAAGNVSAPSAIWNVNLDTSVPTVRTISASNDNVDLHTGDIASGTLTNDATPLMSGTAEADSKVSVYDGTVLLGTTTASGLGIWSFTPTLVGDRVHDITITSTDAAGNVSSQSAIWKVNLDTSVPTVRTISASNDNVALHTGDIASGTLTNDATPLMSGTAEADSVVSLYDGTMLLGTTTASGVGIWSFTPTLVGDRVHDITITSTDAAGNVSSPSAIWNVNLDTSAPTVRTITASRDNVSFYTGDIASGAATNDATPLMSGTAEADSVVSLYEGTVLLGTTTASALGIWRFTPTLVGDRSHDITITSTDAAGNVSSPSAVWSVNLDTTAPTAAPVITSVVDDQGTSTGNIVSNVATITDDPYPFITGTSEPNGSVVIKDGTQQIGTASVDGAGIWTFTPTTPLLNGVHHITATAVDVSGNTGATSIPFDFTLITGGVATAPAITNVIDDVGNIENIAKNGLTNDPTPTVKGTAHAGDTVTLYRDTNVVLGTYLVRADGQWSITVPTLADGTYSFTATATDANLNLSPRTGVYQITVDTQAPGPATVLTLTDNVNPRTGLITNGTTTDDATPTFEGTAEVGATVEIKDGVNPLGSALVNNLGRWTFTPTTPLDDGVHSFTATVTDKAGNPSPATTPINFSVDTKQVVIAIDSVFDDVNAITGNLAANASTNDLRPTISGTATPGGTVKLYVDGVFFAGATATVGSDGQWHITPGTDLLQGPHLLTATVTTSAAGESLQTGPFTLTVDTIAPATPTIASVGDDVGLKQGNVPEGASSDDSTPTLEGAAEAGSTVSVLDGNQLLGTTTANASGRWQFTPASPLDQGTHTFTVKATDAAGNVSLLSDPRVEIINIAPVLGSTVLNDLVAGLLPAPDLALGTLLTLPNIEGPVAAGQLPPGWVITGRDPDTVNPSTGGPYGPIPNVVGGNFSGNAIAFSNNDNLGADALQTSLGGLVVGRVYSIAVAVQTTAPSGGASMQIIETNSGHLVDYHLESGVGWDTLTYTFTATTTLATFLFRETPGTPPHGYILMDTTPSGNSAELVPNFASALANAPTVGELFASTHAYDPDHNGNIKGYAITGAGSESPSGGHWEYYDPTTAAWVNLSGASFQAAVFLAPDVRIHWNDTNRTHTPLTGVAVDNTSTAHTGDLINVVQRGDSTPYSELIASFQDVPFITSSNDNVALHTGDIANGVATNDPTPLMSGTAEANILVSLYDGTVLLGTTTANSLGVWTFTPTLVGDRVHVITVKATDATGNISNPSDVWNVNLDTTVPTVRTITASNDNVTLYIGDIASGTATNDATPLMSGTAEADSLVSVYDGTVLLGTTTASGLGIWSFTPTLVGDRTHAITITSTDAAGNASLASTTWNVELDTTAPVFTTTGAPSANENIASGTVIYTPAATDAHGITYSITGGDDSSLFTIDAATGRVSLKFTPDYETPLDTGGNNVYQFTVTATDAAGNQTSQNASFTVINITENPVNLIVGGSEPGLGWTVDIGIDPSFVDGFSAGNSPLTGGLFGNSTTPINKPGVLNSISDLSGSIGNNIKAIYETPITLINGKTYDFAFDAAGSPNPSAGIAVWVLLPITGNTILTTIEGSRISTAGSGAIPGATIGSTWTNIQTTFVNDNPTGQYRLALEWTFTGTSNGDLGFDRIYLSEQQAITPATPPITFDLNHDGLISYVSTGIDINGNGANHSAAWIGSSDGVLIWDKYHDNQVHDSSQYAFAQYLKGAKTDLEGLKDFDTNGDGKIGSGDAAWTDMRIWQDLNQNGLSDAGEVKTLADWGITSIDLKSDGVASNPATGVHETGKTSATLTDGTKMVVADVAFDTATTDNGGVVAHPFVIDLNHDGKISYGKELINTSGATGATALTAWAGRDDGVLVWDKYHDNQLHDSSQYSFGSLSGANAAMQGLKIFDTNTDGKLDSHDVLWNELGVWQIGFDGAGSMKTLAQLGIESISLTSDGKAGKPADGVTEAGRTTATLTNGDTLLVADAMFSPVAIDSTYDQNQHRVM